MLLVCFSNLPKACINENASEMSNNYFYKENNTRQTQ